MSPRIFKQSFKHKKPEAELVLAVNEPHRSYIKASLEEIAIHEHPYTVTR